MVAKPEILTPSAEAIEFVLTLDQAFAAAAWKATLAVDGRSWYPQSLQGMYQCKTDFDANRSHAQRIWKTFMAEYITRRVSQ